MNEFVVEAEDQILAWGDWEAWADSNAYGAGTKPQLVKLVEWELDEVPGDGWYESHPQGHEGLCYLIFEVGGRFYRKTGTTDSYGRRSWDGKFREVTKGEVIVTKYEWKEN